MIKKKTALLAGLLTAAIVTCGVAIAGCNGDDNSPPPEIATENNLTYTYLEANDTYSVKVDNSVKSTVTSLTVPATFYGKAVSTTVARGFSDCTNLESITFEGATTIGQRSFASLKKLKSVTLGAGAVSVGDNAFSSCTALATVTIPEGLETIGKTAFKSTAVTTLTLPATLTSVGESAFESCTSLTSLTVNGATDIGKAGLIWATNT